MDSYCSYVRANFSPQRASNLWLISIFLSPEVSAIYKQSSLSDITLVAEKNGLILYQLKPQAPHSSLIMATGDYPRRSMKRDDVTTGI